MFLMLLMGFVKLALPAEDLGRLHILTQIYRAWAREGFLKEIVKIEHIFRDESAISLGSCCSLSPAQRERRAFTD